MAVFARSPPRRSDPRSQGVSESSRSATESGQAPPDRANCGSLFLRVRGDHERGIATALGLLAVTERRVRGGCMSSSDATPLPAWPSAPPRGRPCLITGPTLVPASPGCASPQGAAVTDQLQGLFVGAGRPAGGPAHHSFTGHPEPARRGGGPAGLDTDSPPAGPRLPRPRRGPALTRSCPVSDARPAGRFRRGPPRGFGNPVRWNTTDLGPSDPGPAVRAPLLDALESNLCIDTSRVYATGFSDGAYMVSLLACAMAEPVHRHPVRCRACSPATTCAAARTGTRHHLPRYGRPDPRYSTEAWTAPTSTNCSAGGSPSRRRWPPSRPTWTVPASPPTSGPGRPGTVAGSDPTDTLLASQVILRRYRCPARTDVEFYIIVGGGTPGPAPRSTKHPPPTSG